MKKIVMIVPDQVKLVTRSEINIYSKLYDVTEDIIIQMFSPAKDYHENIFFEDAKSIRIESIEHIN